MSEELGKVKLYHVKWTQGFQLPVNLVFTASNVTVRASGHNNIPQCRVIHLWKPIFVKYFNSFKSSLCLLSNLNCDISFMSRRSNFS